MERFLQVILCREYSSLSVVRVMHTKGLITNFLVFHPSTKCQISHKAATLMCTFLLSLLFTNMLLQTGSIKVTLCSFELVDDSNACHLNGRTTALVIFLKNPLFLHLSRNSPLVLQKTASPTILKPCDQQVRRKIKLSSSKISCPTLRNQELDVPDVSILIYESRRLFACNLSTRPSIHS